MQDSYCSELTDSSAVYFPQNIPCKGKWDKSEKQKLLMSMFLMKPSDNSEPDDTDEGNRVDFLSNKLEVYRR